MGTELAGGLLVFCLLGYWIDYKFGTRPWGLVIGAILGIVGGLYNLIRVALLQSLGVKPSRTTGPSSDDAPSPDPRKGTDE
jgi:F0F1-type ATP synthase assembly protein I